MKRWCGTVVRAVRFPYGWSLLIVVLLAVSVAAFVNFWAQKQYEQAKQDLAKARLDEALDHVKHCMRIWRRSPSAHLLAARIQRCRGQYEEAEAHLEEARRLRKAVDEDWQLEWVLLRAQRGGELEEVESALWNCVKQDHPDTLMILQTLARSYIRHMRYNMALATLEQWIKREPDSARALDWRGWVRERIGQKELAEEDYRLAVELDPNQLEARLRLADLLLQHSETDAVKPHISWLQSKHPDDRKVRLLLARYRLLQGEIDETRSVLEKVLAAHPDDADAQYYWGKLELLANRPTQAEPWLRKALRQQPFHLEALIALQNCLHAQGRDADALLKRIETIRHDGHQLASLLGQQQLETMPTDPQLPSEIGVLLLRIGHEQIGLYWLETVALKRDPQHGPTHRVLADYYDKKDPAKAARHRQAAEARSSP